MTVGGVGNRFSENFFLYSLFSKISPQCNIPNGNHQEGKILLVLPKCDEKTIG
jgi:hypothetical protein